jgi:hypothetical protein
LTAREKDVGVFGVVSGQRADAVRTQELLLVDHLLFYEYFHGDNGAGIGANHQTGWTGLSPA